jgi:hypothetical protein
LEWGTGVRRAAALLVLNVPPFLSAAWGFDEARSVTRPPDALN